MFQTKLVDKIKTHILCSAIFSRKLYRLWDNVEKYGRAGQATDDKVIRRRKSAICLQDNYGKNTDTPLEYLIIIA
jgi:hypothetical protein